MWSVSRIGLKSAVSVQMKRKTFVWLAVTALILAGVSAWFWTHRNRWPFVPRGVVHQLPYKWDSYVRPDLQFTMEPMSNVIGKVNAAIRDASNNAVPEAIKLDATPTRVVKVGSNPLIDQYMDELIAEFREHETEMIRRGAEGFESTPFTGTLDGHHSLWCMLGMRGAGGLDWEAKEDALHVSRWPHVMECRPYYIADDLFVRMKQQRSDNRYKVGAEPIVSALIEETGIHSWSVMLPDGPNRGKSESRFDKVFRYVPDLNFILALATPEEHAEAKRRLNESGLWVAPEETQEGLNKPDAGEGT